MIFNQLFLTSMFLAVAIGSLLGRVISLGGMFLYYVALPINLLGFMLLYLDYKLLCGQWEEHTNTKTKYNTRRR